MARRLYPLFFLSGAAGVGYQIVWTKMFAAGLGHETPALVAVVSAFFGGLALGSWTLDRRVALSPITRKWYGVLELIIGSWACLSALFIPLANQIALGLTGVRPTPAWQGLVAFAVPFIALLPATFALGATFPAMERWLAPLTADGRCLGKVYALNTAGAVAGVLGAAFLLMPALGLRGSVFALAALNLFCGVVALMGIAHPSKIRVPTTPPESLSLLRLRTTLFATGLLGIGYEIAGVRVLSQVLENTIYTFAAALSVYLLGTALGAALYQRFGRFRPVEPVLSKLLCALAAACVAGTWFLARAPTLYEWSRERLGNELWSVALSEMVVSVVVFSAPTLFMGAVFSLLAQAARREDCGIGRAAALNTLGATLAGGFFGTFLLPAVGGKWALVIAGLGYVLLLPRWRGKLWIGTLPALALVFTLPTELRFVKIPAGAKLRDYREGTMASIAVVETSDGHRALRVNNRFQMGGTAAALAERRQAHIPLLLHPAPKRALFLGPGTGITLGAASLHPGLESDGVELIPEAIALMRHFEPENEGPLPKPGINLYAADARRFVRTTEARYDVIVADLFHPAQDGAGFLYTREHFEAIRQRLNPGGLFCQWLPLHQMDEATLRVIVRTFTRTFSQSRAFLLHFNVDIPVLGLVGTVDRLSFPPDWLERRLSSTELQQRMKGVGLDRTINLFGCLAAGPEALEQFAGDADVATDDDPRVTFMAPRFAIRRDTRPHELLLNFLTRCRALPGDLLANTRSAETAAFAVNLASFFAARDIYLKGLVEESTGNLSAAIDSYLDSARRSLYFTPAYARCVGIIQMLAATDKAAARQLFDRLEEAQPEQPLGRKMLGRLLDLEAPAP